MSKQTTPTNPPAPPRIGMVDPTSYEFRSDRRPTPMNVTEDRILAALEAQGTGQDVLLKLVRANVVHPDSVLRLAGLKLDPGGKEYAHLCESYITARNKGGR